MTNKDIIEAAEENAKGYCIQRGMAKAAFIEGALWAMKQCRQIVEDAREALEIEEKEING